MKTTLVLLLLSAHVTLGQPAQVILLRHGEKSADPAATHLSARGAERGHALASLLGQYSPLIRDAAVAALYATRVTKHGNGIRTSETLTPLARKLGLIVQTPFASEDFRLLARRVPAEPAYRGKTVIIRWTHHELAALAEKLGVKPQPPKWKDEVFDRLWVIDFINGRAKLRDLPQDLLPGDARQ